MENAIQVPLNLGKSPAIQYLHNYSLNMINVINYDNAAIKLNTLWPCLDTLAACGNMNCRCKFYIMFLLLLFNIYYILTTPHWERTTYSIG